MAGSDVSSSSFTPWNSSGEHFYHLDASNISLCLLVLGAYLTTINQLSYYLKERLYISSALISFCVGVAFGPIGANIVSPYKWSSSEETLHELTFQLTRLIIGIQVMFAGIALPAAYLKRQWKSLFILLLPIMTIAWFVCAGFIKLFIPELTFLEALVIAACVAPTDPILANAIVKGRFAEKYVPKPVRDVLSAESGANDGLGYPFMFIAIFLMDRKNQTYGNVTIGRAIGHWIVATWFYQLLLACAMGALIGYLARKSLKAAHTAQLIDHESFLAYGIGLTFLTLGAVGSIGSDDVLACFIAGNSLTWRDFYRIEAFEEETFQDVIDGLLNAAIFIYVGALMPWSELGEFGLVPWKLVLLSLCILFLRRPPWVFAMYKITPAIPDRQQALFAGWFGPIGISAIYYAELALKELPAERTVLREVIFPVVMFIAFSSTLVHGITIPMAKHMPRAFTRTHSVASSFIRSKTSKSVDASKIKTPFRTDTAEASDSSTSTVAAAGGSSTGPDAVNGQTPARGQGKHMVEILVGDRVRVVTLDEAQAMQRQSAEHRRGIAHPSASIAQAQPTAETRSDNEKETAVNESEKAPTRPSTPPHPTILRSPTATGEQTPEGAQTPKREVAFDV